MAKIRISELPELTSGSINTILVGNDNNVTYKIPLTVLTASVVQMLSESTDARLDLLEQFESEFLPFSSSVHDLIIAATNEQSLGHLITTSSFNTFTSSYQTDSASFNNRINNSQPIGYLTTASYQTDSASFSSRIEAATNEQYLAGFATTSSVNNLSTSVDSRLDVLENFSSSADSRYVLSGSITQTTWDNIENKPNGIVSSSTQIKNYGDFATTGSNTFVGNQTITGSIYLDMFEQIKVGDFNSINGGEGTLTLQNTNGYITLNPKDGGSDTLFNVIGQTGEDNIFIVMNNEGGAAQLSFNKSGSLNISTNNTVIPTLLFNDVLYDAHLVTTSSFESYTQSIDNRVSGLEAQTASYLTSLDGAISNSAQVDYNYILNTPNNIISSSTQISELGFVTGAYVTINEYNSLTQSFNQITESYYTLSGSFGSIDFSGINAVTESYLQFTQSYYSDSSSVDGRLIALETAVDNDSMYLTTASFETYTQSIDNRVSGLEAQTSSYLTTLDGAITSSQQIADLGFITGVVDIDNYVTTASYDIDSASFSSRIDAATNEQFLGGFATTSSLESVSASAWGAFQSASSYSSSLATAISASDAEYTSFSASLQSTITTLSTSVDSRLDTLETFSASADARYVEASETSSMAVSSSLYSVSSSVSITASFSHRTAQTDVYVKNVSGAQIDKGKVVRISGATGDNPLIVTASFLTEGQSANTLGITTQNIPNDSFGYVITEGILMGVNTTGMNAGELLYLGSTGSFTTTPPTAPNHGVRLGEVLREQQNNGSIYVRVDNGSELGEAHNVVDTSTNSSYGDILMKSGSVWINDNTFSSSLDSRIKNITVGSASVPDGTISSSQQIETLGFITSSTPTDLSGLNTISSSYLDFTQSYYSDSSSFDLRILDLVNNTGSYETTGRGIISESVVTISETQPAVGVGNLWYDSNIGNLYLHYASGTWVDTSNGVIQTILSDGSLLSTASFNAWTASFTASVPAGTISSSTQITTFGFVSGSYETTGRGIISSSTQISDFGFVTSGGNATFNSITANQYIVSSSVYYVTQSYSSGSTMFGNTIDDTHEFTGSVSISGSLTITGSLNIANGASLGARLYQMSDVNDTITGSTDGYLLTYSSGSNSWYANPGAGLKGTTRLFISAARTNGNPFYFTAIQITSDNAASPDATTAFMITTALLNKVTVYLRQDQAGPNTVLLRIDKNANGSAFSSATSVVSSSLSLTGNTVQTYTFNNLTLNQFDSLHFYCDPTNNPGQMYGIVVIE